jgi:hypothetical protein
MKRISKRKGRLLRSWRVSGTVHIDNIAVLWYYWVMNAPAQAIARYVTEIDKIYRAG